MPAAADLQDAQTAALAAMHPLQVRSQHCQASAYAHMITQHSSIIESAAYLLLLPLLLLLLLCVHCCCHLLLLLTFTGSVECSTCSPGYYQGEGVQASCDVCAVGSFQATSGSIECHTCPVGKLLPLLPHSLPPHSYSHYHFALYC